MTLLESQSKKRQNITAPRWFLPAATLYVSLLAVAALAKSQPLQLNDSPRLVVQTGHTFTIESIAFSPDGKLLASIGSGGILKLWDVQTAREIRTTVTRNGDGIFEIGGESIVAFSPDSKTIATTVGSSQIKLWDVSSGKKLKVCNESGNFESIAFSPNGGLLATGGGNDVKLWNPHSCENMGTLKGHSGTVRVVAFSGDGNMIASGGEDASIRVWDVRAKRLVNTLVGHTKAINSLAWSPNGEQLISSATDGTAKIWDGKSGKVLKTREMGHFYGLVLFSKEGFPLVVDGKACPRLETFSPPHPESNCALTPSKFFVDSIAISPDNKTIASGNRESGPELGVSHFSIKLWDSSGREAKTFVMQSSRLVGFSFSANGRFLVSVEPLVRNRVRVFDILNGKVITKYLNERIADLSSVAISNDGKIFAASISAGSGKGSIIVWDLSSGAELQRLRQLPDTPNRLAFSDNSAKLAGRVASTVKLWQVNSGKEIASVSANDDNGITNQILTSVPDYKWQSTAAILFPYDPGRFQRRSMEEIAEEAYAITLMFSRKHQSIKPGGSFGITESEEDILSLFKTKTDGGVLERDLEPVGLGVSSGFIGRLVLMGDEDWAFVTPDGRFDTSLLEKQLALHWVLPAEPLKPKPLELFSRQYFEPQLLPRLLKCSEVRDCDQAFKRLPAISVVNFIQPEVIFQNVRLGSSSNLVDITLQVRNVTDESSNAIVDTEGKHHLSSGAYDLRLFRDGQLVGVSTPKDKLAAFISDAPRLISEARSSGKLLDTSEDRAWRDANDLFRLKSENVKVISADKVQYTFRNIKLPQDGRKEVNFTAYVFNSDRVKSLTTEPYKFTVPSAVVNSPRKGRAFLISIGVNASENPAYALRYAVNDARKMQEIVGARLKADRDKYSDVIQIPLISDYDANKKLAENTAQKAIIKGVFSIIAGNAEAVPPAVLERIPNREKIKPVEPEDTLIITYSGHGYADQSGIFYLLPFDIGANTKKLTPEVLNKLISSDELSLWMQDITAAEMIMIIDACQSSAAVQGDGFKPGPMGSRGLGQLAYDKNMKILSATQADNIALELNSLEQGLLSYALTEDGIKNELADIDKNRQLSATEWLSFGEIRVPELYREIRQGKRSVIINGRRRDTLDTEFNIAAQLKMQSPHLFSFKRMTSEMTLFTLP